MNSKAIFSNWSKVAGLLLIGGALAWAIKLSVIVSTNGRIIDTGAAALCMKIGLLLFFVGSTGIGTRLSRNGHPVLRVLAIALSPVVVFGSLFVFGMTMGPLVKNSGLWYAEQEVGIAVGVLIYFVVGLILYSSYRSLAV